MGKQQTVDLLKPFTLKNFYLVLRNQCVYYQLLKIFANYIKNIFVIVTLCYQEKNDQYLPTFS